MEQELLNDHAHETAVHPAHVVPQDRVARVLEQAVEHSRGSADGVPATYCPDLANAPVEATSGAIALPDGTRLRAGDAGWHRLTWQSAAKLLLLTALLEEWGVDRVFSVVNKEPSGASFASIAQLESDGPLPANPLINAGAIALCGQIGGSLNERMEWLHGWVEHLVGSPLDISWSCQAWERATGHHNRAMAHLLRAKGVIAQTVDEALETYFALCSLESYVHEIAEFAARLARGGLTAAGERVMSASTVTTVVSLMATCGMYDESGAHMVATGLPAKSGVSGVIVAVAPARGGIAVASPRLNPKGGSVRGHIMLQHLSRELGWHFARPSDGT